MIGLLLTALALAAPGDVADCPRSTTMVEALIATRDLAPGTTLTDAHLTPKTVACGELPRDALRRGAVGRVVHERILPDEWVRASRLVAPDHGPFPALVGEGTRALAVPVAPVVAEALPEGGRFDVLWSGAGDLAGEGCVLLDGAQALREPVVDEHGAWVFVAAPATTAARLAWGEAHGAFHLALRAPGNDVSGDTGAGCPSLTAAVR